MVELGAALGLVAEFSVATAAAVVGLADVPEEGQHRSRWRRRSHSDDGLAHVWEFHPSLSPNHSCLVKMIDDRRRRWVQMCRTDAIYVGGELQVEEEGLG